MCSDYRFVDECQNDPCCIVTDTSYGMMCEEIQGSAACMTPGEIFSYMFYPLIGTVVVFVVVIVICCCYCCRRKQRNERLNPSINDNDEDEEYEGRPRRWSHRNAEEGDSNHAGNYPLAPLPSAYPSPPCSFPTPPVNYPSPVSVHNPPSSSASYTSSSVTCPLPSVNYPPSSVAYPLPPACDYSKTGYPQLPVAYDYPLPPEILTDSDGTNSSSYSQTTYSGTHTSLYGLPYGYGTPQEQEPLSSGAATVGLSHVGDILENG